MQPCSPWPGLASLDRRFGGVFPGDRIEALFPAGSGRELIRRGVLKDAGLSLTIPHCICDLRRPSCVVRVDGSGGAYRGYCNEYGRPLPVSLDQIQRYAFDWRAWAELLRRRNRLGGAGPVQGTGALYVGCGTVGGRQFGLVVVAPGCTDVSAVVLPSEAVQATHPLVALLLGAGAEGLPVSATVAADGLGPDLATIDAAALELALDAVPLVVDRTAAKCLLYSHEHPKGRPIDEAEYEHLHRAAVLKTFDLFVDLLQCKVWRAGRAHVRVLDAKGRPTGKNLGDRALSLLADYMRRPGVPMAANETPTYRDAPAGPRTPGVLFGQVRRSIRGSAFLVSGARASRQGDTTYVFQPGSMSWCLLAPMAGR